MSLGDVDGEQEGHIQGADLRLAQAPGVLQDGALFFPEPCPAQSQLTGGTQSLPCEQNKTQGPGVFARV